MNKRTRLVLASVFAVFAVGVGAAVALFDYATEADKQHFREAKNACERGCIQDSGGLDQCRVVCKDHPDRYP